MEIFVTGKQWMWKVEHPEGQREINELHVPLGRPVKLTMTSEDVIHDFFVPAFRVKKDVLPGRYTSLWFAATKMGTFHLFCAQYCGAFHAGMIGSVIVMEPDEYERWLAAERRENRWKRRAQKYFRSAAAPRATLPTARARPIAARRLRTTSAADHRRDRHGGRRLYARVHLDSQSENRSGLHADHAVVPGTTHGRADQQSDRLHSLAGQGAAEAKGRGEAMSTATLEPRVHAQRNYLNADYGWKSWLFTLDHKRIALLYLVSITFFFFIGGSFAVLMRIHLVEPQGALVQPETYNKLFTLHGIIMIFFFLIPSIPAVLGNFLVPLMVGARDLAFPQAEPAELVHLHRRRPVHAVFGDRRRRGYRLDVLHALQQHVLEYAGHCRGDRRIHHRIFLDSHRPEFHRHHSQDARPGHDLVPHAAVPVGHVRHQHHHGAGHAGAGDHASFFWRSSICFTWEFSARRWAATRCCSSIYSGSIRTRPFTS